VGLPEIAVEVSGMVHQERQLHGAEYAQKAYTEASYKNIEKLSHPKPTRKLLSLLEKTISHRVQAL
jgi:hypothetical protein